MGSCKTAVHQHRWEINRFADLYDLTMLSEPLIDRAQPLRLRASSYHYLRQSMYACKGLGLCTFLEHLSSAAAWCTRGQHRWCVSSIHNIGRFSHASIRSIRWSFSASIRIEQGECRLKRAQGRWLPLCLQMRVVQPGYEGSVRREY